MTNTKKQLIEKLRGPCMVTGPKPLTEIHELCQGEIVRRLPELPGGCTHWELRPPEKGEVYVGTDGGIRTALNYHGAASFRLVACKPAPCGTACLDIMEPGVFMWEGKVYYMREWQSGDDMMRDILTVGGDETYRKHSGEWRQLDKCFGTSDISGLCEETVQRPTGWV